MPYEHLAFHYDALMRKMDYGAYAGYLLSLAGQRAARGRSEKGNGMRVLDLACGTGRLAEALCERGCDVTAVDGSAEMLSAAGERKLENCLFLHQDMTGLDLYGTVEAAFCTIDALNYLLTPQKLKKAFERVRLFLEPGGAFAFDVLTPAALAARDGAVFMSDAEGVYCTWCCSWKAPLCRQEVTLFIQKNGGLWERHDEVHTERAYEPDFIEKALLEAGFSTVRQHAMMEKRPPVKDDERIVFLAR